MGSEIERKFLVKPEMFANAVAGAPAVHMKQGYLSRALNASVRVRVAGDRGILSVKGRVHGFSRSEYEYDIPVADAEAMMQEMCGNIIDKRRYFVEYHGYTWEIDEFFGDNAPLLLAEIELNSEADEFPLPDFIGREVTGIAAFYNGTLARAPFKLWIKDVPEFN